MTIKGAYSHYFFGHDLFYPQAKDPGDKNRILKKDAMGFFCPSYFFQVSEVTINILIK